MKIILISTVNRLGKVGDVITVRDGYAKNFLIPGKKAIYYSEQNFKTFKDKKHEFELRNTENFDLASKLKESLADKDVVIIENASDDGRLYGSVNSQIIANKINELLSGKSASRNDVFLAKPIKEVGVHMIKLHPHPEVSFDLKVIVSRSESEAEVLRNSKAVS